MFIAVRGMPGADERLFAGKKRFTHLVMQGRLKRPVKAQHLVGCGRGWRLGKRREGGRGEAATCWCSLCRISDRVFGGLVGGWYQGRGGRGRHVEVLLLPRPSWLADDPGFML